MTPRSDNDDALWTERLRPTLAPLPGEDFTHRVLTALPAPKPARLPRSRLAFGAAGALAGLACALIAGGGQPGDLEPAVTAVAQALHPLTDPMMLFALAVAGLSLAYAFRSGSLRRPAA